MTELASISTAAAETGVRRRQGLARDDAPSFTYALAAASLEKNAAKSLEAHGAKPAGAGDAATQSTDASSGADPSPGAARQTEKTAAENGRASDANAAPQRQAGAQTKWTAADGASSPAPAAPIASLTAPLASAKPLEASALRDNAVARKPAAALKATRQPSEPASVKAAFAEILAKRLEKTSVFDIRLDPPDLGRVEGRLAIGDDGKAVLSLTFDNQNAFDLFSRDEQTLRQALADAGLNFSAGDFAFAFREPAQPQTLLTPSANAPRTPSVYEPVFFADWSAGALDIRI